MNTTTKDILAPEPSEVRKYYKNVHLDLDLLFVKTIPFLLAKLRDIKLINCKAILNQSKKVQNGLKSIVLDEVRRFKVTSAFTDNAFKPLIV